MEPALAIFAPLLGKCFAAAVGPGITDVHCFSDVYSGAHVRDTHVVKTATEPVYFGETIYSMGSKGPEFTHVNSDGGVGHGTVSITAPHISFKGSMSDPAFPPRPMSAEWTIGKDGYVVAVEGQPTRRFVRSR